MDDGAGQVIAGSDWVRFDGARVMRVDGVADGWVSCSSRSLADVYEPTQVARVPVSEIEEFWRPGGSATVAELEAAVRLDAHADASFDASAVADVPAAYVTGLVESLALECTRHPDQTYVLEHAAELVVSRFPIAGEGPRAAELWHEAMGWTAPAAEVVELAAGATPNCVTELEAAVAPVVEPSAAIGAPAEVRLTWAEPYRLSADEPAVTTWTGRTTQVQAPATARLETTEGTAVAAEVLVDGHTVEAYVNPGRIEQAPTVDQLRDVTVGLVNYDPFPGLDQAVTRPVSPVASRPPESPELAPALRLRRSR